VGEEGLKGQPMPDSGGGPGFASAGPGGGTTFHFSSGGPGGMGGMPGGAYHFSARNANDIFRQFFGGQDPFAGGGTGSGDEGEMFGGMGGIPGGFSRMGGMGGHRMAPAAMPKGATIHYPLNCSLEELFNGATKKMRITKKLVDASGQAVEVKKEVSIEVKPGWKSGTKVTFEREGDELPGQEPADITFTVQAKPHERFTRDVRPK
jgi:DnaJ family protein B protein 4